MLIEAFNEWLRIPDDKKQSIKEITQMLHNASLIVDDIEDNSKLRRGIPGDGMLHQCKNVTDTCPCLLMQWLTVCTEYLRP